MKRILATIATLVAFTVAAVAADVPRKYDTYSKGPINLFSGWWVGGEAGYGWSNLGTDINGVSLNPKGGIFGASLTYRSPLMQGSNMYVGLSTNMDWANVNDTISPAKNVAITAKQNWLGSTTLQLGYVVMPAVLVYGEGGVAYGRTKATAAFGNNSISDTSPSVGWTIGGGVDWAFANNWTTGFKYSYTDLGKASYCAVLGSGVCVGTHANETDNRVLWNIKYRFGN